MNEHQANAAILLKATLGFMAQKAGVTPDEILSVIAADPHGATTRYFSQLIAIGIPVLAKGA